MSSLMSDQSGTNSTSVQMLQEALNMHLDMSQKMQFVAILNEFQMSRNVPKLIKQLKLLLDTPAKKQILTLIRKVIPKSNIDEYDKCIKFNSGKYDTVPLKKSRKILQKSRLPLQTLENLTSKNKEKGLRKTKVKSKDEYQSDSSKNTLKASSRSLRSVKGKQQTGSDVMHVYIRQSSDIEKEFGFSIRGGSEFGIGIYVSMVDQDGMAEKQGLLPGDRLMEVNGISFDQISHNQATEILQSSDTLDLKICRVGHIPGSLVVHQSYKWIDRWGQPASPPPELEHLQLLHPAGTLSGYALFEGSDICKVNIKLDSNQKLGLMIRGGREFGLGIYISGVDSQSVADVAGLKVGDQILDVNGQSFLDIFHADAVHVIKKLQHLALIVKDVGKLPFAKTNINQTSPRTQRQKKDSHNSDNFTFPGGSKNTVFIKGIGSQLMLNTAISTKWDAIENLTAKLLNDKEQGALYYYLSEYQNGFITVDGLAMASCELLNTKSKMTMMCEIRNLVKATDLGKFDTLLQRREALQKHGFLPRNFSSYSPNGRGHVTQESSSRFHTHKMSVSAPASYVTTVQERPSQVCRYATDWELQPLRKAIELIEEDSAYHQAEYRPQVRKHRGLQKLSKLKSRSTDHLSTPNLLKTSLSSRRSLSEDMLIPVYIDTTSDLPPSPRLRSDSDSSMQSRQSIAFYSQRLSSSSNTHQQKSMSNNSSLQKKQRSVKGFRVSLPREKTKSYMSRRSAAADVQNTYQSKSLSTADTVYSISNGNLTNTEPTDTDIPRLSMESNVAHAEIHHPPKPLDIPTSDDSGVDVNVISSQDINSRVTISSDNPVDIDDALESRSFILPSHDSSNTSTLTNHSVHSRSNVSTPTNKKTGSSFNKISREHSPKLSISTGLSSSHGNDSRRPPVEIEINDGNGLISSWTPKSHSFPEHMNELDANQSYVRKSFVKSKTPSCDSDDGGCDDDDMSECSSETGDNSYYISSLDRILDAEDSSYRNIMVTQQLVKAKQKYGDIPLKIVPVYKTKPMLGMAIEGGAKTRQPLPRIISLQPGGSAYECGSLKIGHVILEVNGRSVIGLEHIAAAKMIAEAFKNKDMDKMELLVTETGVKLQDTQ